MNLPYGYAREYLYVLYLIGVELGTKSPSIGIGKDVKFYPKIQVHVCRFIIWCFKCKDTYFMVIQLTGVDITKGIKFNVCASADIKL